ncbi:hypothetical protein MKW94_023165 [Papaver nudicaule]|uniref:AB hydrolase-1 domain-containing protein n=1 Tax=Papaver nudicaule TaxID=74823 RepID=A0AA41VIV3_PAPNU|nr:hypothetical protein [Papaver nudicaule]
MTSTSSHFFNSLSNKPISTSNPRLNHDKIFSSISFRNVHTPKFTSFFTKPRFSLRDSRRRHLSLNASSIDPIEEVKTTTTTNPDVQVQSCDHWRKNIPVLAKTHRVYAIDLIGYGYSDKPNPREFGDKSFYTFDTWAAQLNEFCTEVIKDEAFFICNSIGGLVGLQAAVMEPQICKGIVLLNISLRMLHIKKQPWFGRPFIRSFQNLLRNTSVGKSFFKAVATPQSVKNILCQCYHDTSQVTDELVEKILLPGLEPGAVDVFLEFICYSDGPLPEELLHQVKCPVLVGWGDKDPWEPIDLGRAYGDFDIVEDFVVLPDVGHCPQDEAPQLVNPLVESFVARHTPTRASAFTV